MSVGAGRRATVSPPCVCVSALLLLAGCHPPDDYLVRLAQAGRIEPGAGIVARNSVTISATQARVWRLLADIDGWPRWHRAVTAAHLDGELAPGTSFTWSFGAVTIRSRLALVQPQGAMAWTGHAFGLYVIHAWSLTTMADGHVLVRTQESMSGFPASLFTSSSELAGDDQAWLQDLKDAAEAPNPVAGRT